MTVDSARRWQLLDLVARELAGELSASYRSILDYSAKNLPRDGA